MKNINLNDLSSHIEKGFGGLTADEHLKLKIEKAASNPETIKNNSRKKLWIPAVACAAAAVVALCIAIPNIINSHSGISDAVISVQSAGSPYTSTDNGEAVSCANHFAITSGNSVPKYQTIWSSKSNNNLPIIYINGGYYRMVNSPSEVPDSALGSSLGSVEVFTDEPSLYSEKSTMSDIAAEGETVYGISGMENTLIAANVNGKMRAFQRTTFSGKALSGKESFSDIMQISGHITAMALSDVGIIEDKDTCDSLFSTLVSNASYIGSSMVTGKQSLIVELDNGMAVQMIIKSSKLSCCGTWNCSEFVEEFANAVNGNNN